MPDELRLSKSSIDAFLECNYAWYLGAVLRIKGAPTLHMIAGRAVHAGIEAHWKGEDHVEATVASWDSDLASTGLEGTEEAAASFLDALRLVGTYIDKIAPTFTPSLVEAKFMIRVDGVLVSGTIDAADENVHDTKTTSTPSKVDPKLHRVEMTIYGWGAQSLTGKSPGKLLLDVVGRNGRTKTAEVEPDPAGTAEVIGYVARKIGEGTFEPNGARTGQCFRCPYAVRCSYAVI